MRIAGWIFMLLSVTFVASLAAWCYHKVLQAPKPGDDDESA